MKVWIFSFKGNIVFYFIIITGGRCYNIAYKRNVKGDGVYEEQKRQLKLCNKIGKHGLFNELFIGFNS